MVSVLLHNMTGSVLTVEGLEILQEAANVAATSRTEVQIVVPIMERGRPAGTINVVVSPSGVARKA